MFLEKNSSEKLKPILNLFKYFLGTIIIITGLVVGYVPLFIMIAASGTTSARLLEFQQTMDFSLLGIDSTVGLVLVITSFIIGLLTLLIIVRGLHKRPFESVITAYNKIRWNRIFYSFGIWITFSAIIEVLAFYLNPQDYIFSFEAKLFFPLLFVSILLLPFQTSFEEIFLRGYLMQGLGLIGVYRIVPVIVTSIIFGLLHIANPEIEKFGAGIMMIFYISFGLVLATIAIMDDGLEIPLGIHAANNIYASVFVSYSGGALQTNALFKTTSMDAEFMFYTWFVMSVLLLVLFSRKYNWGSWKKLFGKIEYSKDSISDFNTSRN